MVSRRQCKTLKYHILVALTIHISHIKMGCFNPSVSDDKKPQFCTLITSVMGIIKIFFFFRKQIRNYFSVSCIARPNRKVDRLINR